MERTPYIRRLRFRNFAHTRHSEITLGWLATQATRLKVTAIAVYELLKGGMSATDVENTTGAGPANTAAPVLSGTATVGSTLTVTDGTWTGTPVPTITRQWLKDGTPIAGETDSTYVLSEADEGGTITVSVVATNKLASAAKASNAVGPVELGE